MSAQRCHTPGREHSLHGPKALAEACMPGCTPPAPRGSGGCSHGIHAPAGEGCAGRLTSGRGVDRSLRSLSNRPGLGVPATPSEVGRGRGGRLSRGG
nr:MAG TPA: hypothetical protein [Caudoviricetes sp.]